MAVAGTTKWQAMADIKLKHTEMVGIEALLDVMATPYKAKQS